MIWWKYIKRWINESALAMLKLLTGVVPMKYMIMTARQKQNKSPRHSWYGVVKAWSFTTPYHEWLCDLFLPGSHHYIFHGIHCLNRSVHSNFGQFSNPINGKYIWWSHFFWMTMYASFCRSKRMKVFHQQRHINSKKLPQNSLDLNMIKNSW